MKLLNPVHPLKQRLKKLKIPQHVAAYSLGLNYTTFCKYLSGQCQMPLKVAQSLTKLIQDAESSR